MTNSRTGFNWPNPNTPDTQSKQFIADLIPANESMVLRYRADKGDDANLIVQLDQFLRAQGKHLDVIYTCDIKAAAVAIVADIKAIQAAGVNVFLCEAGNEVYSVEQYNFVFDSYRQAFEPLLAICPVPMSLFLAPRPSGTAIKGGRSVMKVWNDACIAYVKAHVGLQVSVHIYFGGNECEVMRDPNSTERAILPVKTVYTQYDPALDLYFKNLYDQADPLELFEPTISYIETALPGVKINITESGFDAAGNLKGGMGYAMTTFKLWCMYGNRCATFLEHAGASMSYPGMIHPGHFGEPDVVRGLNYYAYQLYRKMTGTILPQGTTITEPGDYSVYGFSVEDLKDTFINPNNLTLKAGDLDQLTSADNYYSPISSVDYFLKGSVIGTEVVIDAEWGDGGGFGKNLYFTAMSFSLLKPVVLPPMPTVNAGADQTVTLSNGSAFANISALATGDKVTALWSDGHTGLSFQALYNTPGIYTLTVTVTDSAGQQATDSVTITFKAQVAPCDPRCSGFWYNLFHKKYCATRTCK